MDAFGLQRHVIADYADYTKSFVRIADERLRRRVEEEMAAGLLWPEPLLQLNPAFEPGRSIDELVDEGVLHRDCGRIFRAKAHDNDAGRAMRLHLHQDQAIEVAKRNRSYVLTTGTGSGKSLSYIIPVVDHVLLSVNSEICHGLRKPTPREGSPSACTLTSRGERSVLRRGKNAPGRVRRRSIDGWMNSGRQTSCHNQSHLPSRLLTVRKTSASNPAVALADDPDAVAL